MKRIPILPIALAVVTLAGCQTIKAHNPFRHKEPAYKAAQQEQPLEVPPGMTAPPTTDALVIPDTGAGGIPVTVESGSASSPAVAPTATTTPPAAAVPGATGNSMTLTDTAASVYHRVGLALARGEVGQVTAHDDSALTYQVAVDSVVEKKSEGGLFHRMFHRNHNETVKGVVTVSVAASGSGSVVTAQGTPDAVARVMGVLQRRLQ